MGQAFKELEVNIEPDISKSLLNNPSPLKPIVDRNTLLKSQGKLARATPQDSIKKTVTDLISDLWLLITIINHPTIIRINLAYFH